MPPHQQRVVEELSDLTSKLDRLRAFFATPLFSSLPRDERGRLHSQAHFMAGYEDVLAQRIAAF